MKKISKGGRPVSPLATAALENFGLFEGRVVTVNAKENKRNRPQVYTTLEQRIRKNAGEKSSYNIVHFVAFDEVAEAYLALVRPGQHVRVHFRATSWRPPGGRTMLSLPIDQFRIYRSTEENLDAWLEEDGLFDAPIPEGFGWWEDEKEAVSR